jgi:signal transduction histidine kinase
VQQTDINKIIRDAVEIIRVSKKAKDVIFNIALYEQPPKLTLVPDQIEQVFINLLLNAADALHDNTPNATVPELRKEKIINVSSTVSDDALFVTVEDNGKGIRQEDLSKIFEPFYTTKKVGEGTGLGLWVSYGIIKSFSGEIRVKSKEGSGTTFTIRLPIHS